MRCWLFGAALLAAGCGASVDARVNALFKAREKGGSDAVTRAVQALQDPAPEVRGIAAWILGDAGKEFAVIPALLPLLEDPSASVRSAALESIQTLDPCGAPSGAVRPLLGDAEPLVRLRAAAALAGCSDTTKSPAIGIFLPLFEDDDDEVRREAALSVAKIAERGTSSDDEDTIRAVTAALGTMALHDPSGQVREAAAIALASLTATPESEVFLELAVADANPLVRLQADRSLTDWRERRAREAAEKAAAEAAAKAAEAEAGKAREAGTEKKPAEDNPLPAAGEGGTGTASSR